MANQKDAWTVSDFLAHFEKEGRRAVEPRFKQKFGELCGELALLDSEFLKMTKGCGGPMDSVVDTLERLAGRAGYCERPRGFEAECDELYRQVDAAIEQVGEFRRICTK